jgi:hypothetical protein
MISHINMFLLIFFFKIASFLLAKADSRMQPKDNSDM